MIHSSRLLGSFKRSFTTVNADELKKFAKIGGDWWNSSSDAGVGPLHAMNPVRVQFIREQVAKELSRTHIPSREQLKSLDILDVGCGGGLLSESLARLGANMTSIDPSPENIRIASSHKLGDPLTNSIDYQSTTIEELCEKEKKFDVVCSLEVLEHVETPKKFLQSCVKSLKPNGNLFISTINRTRKSHLLTIVGAEYMLNLVPPGTHEFDKYIKPEELRMWINEIDPKLKIVSMKGLVIKPPRLSSFLGKGLFNWELSDSDLEVNYIAHIKLE